MVGAPPQPFTMFGTAAITTPAGNASLKVTPERAGEPATAVPTRVPEGHVVVTFGAAATSTFAGNASTQPMPACAGLPAALVMVKVRVEVAPWLMTLGLNALLKDACTTVSVRLVTLLV